MNINPENKESTPRPGKLDVVKIDGRWAQVILSGEHIRYLDDNSEVEINWNDYNFQPTEALTVGDLVKAGEIGEDNRKAIHWGPEDVKNPSLKNHVHVFGYYSKTK